MKKVMTKLMNRIIKGYTLFDTPSILNILCKKYPNKRWLLWLIWQIKEYAIYTLWLYILWFVSVNCNPYLICKPCLEIVGYPFNQTIFNITNAKVLP